MKKIFCLIPCVLLIASCSSPSNRETFEIPQIGMTFTYNADVFQIPQKYGPYSVDLYEKEKSTNGAGVVDIRFTPQGFRPEYGTSNEDYIGDIVSERPLEELCNDPRWTKYPMAMEGCRVVASPIPHVEFFTAHPGLGDRETFFEKRAIFLTGNPELPGVIISTNAKELTEKPALSQEAMQQKLDAFANGTLKSAFIDEMDTLIRSIEFK